MNGKRPMHPNDDGHDDSYIGPRDDTGLDPDLLALFDEPAKPIADNAFTATLLLKMQRARRARLFWQMVTFALVMLSSAVAAPYVAQATLFATGWLTLSQPIAATEFPLAAPLAACACAALVAWRIARRA